MAKKTILDKIKGPEPRMQVNVRVPISIYEQMVKQISIDKNNGEPTTWSRVVCAGFELYLKEKNGENNVKR